MACIIFFFMVLFIKNFIILISLGRSRSKVHRALLSRAEVLLNSQDIQMEVSSPGLNRVIKNAAEFQAFIGENIKVLEVSCPDWVEGELLAADSTGICLSISGGQRDIRYTDIKKAKLNKI